LASGGREGQSSSIQAFAKPGRVTVPHPVRDLKIGTVKSIERQSGVKLR
jgi:predicted RNA binding protein YcfA (HicA-like mRNA interferase family)